MILNQKGATRLTAYSGSLVLILCLIFFLRKVDTTLIYYWQQTVPSFLTDYLDHPGGFSYFVGDHFIGLLSRPICGMIALTILVIINFLSLTIIFRRLKGNPFFHVLIAAALIPFAFLMAHYRFPIGLLISMTTGYILTALFSFYSHGKIGPRSLYYFLAGIFVYYVSGSAGLLIFLQGIFIQVFFSGKFSGVLSILPILLIPAIYLPFNSSFTFKIAYLDPILISNYFEIPVMLYISIFSMILLMLLMFGVTYIFNRLSLKRPFLLTGAGMIIVLVVFLFTADANSIETEKNVFQVEKAGYEKDWDKVLELADQQTRIYRPVQFQINRALYHKGILLEDLFRYPQQFGVRGLFLEDIYSSRVAVLLSDFYTDMRFANEARHWANEANIGLDRHPVVLKNLTVSYLALGYNKMATEYLDILKRTRLYKEWCEHISEIIDDKRINEDPVIEAFRANNPGIDFFASTNNPADKIMKFYFSTENNKMAFEYLVASNLLQHRIGDVIYHLKGFRNLGYNKLPRNVEEAILVYMARTNTSEIPLQGYTVSTETREEFQDFNRLVSKNKDREQRMMLAAKYKKTYWYYILFSSPYASK